MKIAFFTIILAIFGLLVIEAFGHGFYYVINGHTLWHIEEVFEVGNFLKETGDERVVTAMGNIILTDHGIAFDENGFRFDKHKQKERNIVLLGDSVPFGYKNYAGETIGAYLYELTGYGVINAALPSYSLHQAVYRYKYEIKDKFNADIVILQVLDPANQVMRYGKKWDRTMSWATHNKTNIRKYSIIAYVLRLIIRSGNVMDHFISENKKDLSILLEDMDGKLILLPPNMNKNVPQAADWLARAYKEFAREHDDVYYLEIRGQLSGEDFSDECCHLTSQGNMKIAQTIHNFILSLSDS